jgi:hypothetical protein
MTLSDHMKNILIFSLLIFASCSYNSEATNKKELLPGDSKIHTVDLADGLGVVTLSLPSRYDTMFTWIHYSDCGKPCEKRKYRFQPKILPVFPETGYYYKPLNDSVDQFTIVHNPYIPVDDIDNPGNKNFITSFHDHKKWNIIHDPSLRMISSDTIEKIGDRYFSIIVINKYDTARAQYSKKLLATTTVRKGTIDFNFEILTRQNNLLMQNFIKDARLYLRTIRFGNAGK